MRELPRLVAETEIGIDVPVRIWRDSTSILLQVNIGELEEDGATQPVLTSDETEEPPMAGRIDELGLELSSLSAGLRKEYLIEDDVNGTVIIDVDDGGPAAEKSLRTGDVVLEVNQTEVNTPADVAQIVNDVIEDGEKNSVLLTVRRQASVRFVGIRVKND